MPVVLLFLYLHSSTSEHVRLTLLHLRFCALPITRALSQCMHALDTSEKVIQIDCCDVDEVFV